MHCGSKQSAGCLGTVLVILIGSGFLSYFLMQQGIGTAPPQQSAVPQKKTPQQIANEKKLAAVSRAKANAFSMCMAAVRSSAKFPSSVDFSSWNSPGTSPLQGGGWAVQLAFEAKNSFGNVIPQMARCDVVKGKMTYFNVANR